MASPRFFGWYLIFFITLPVLADGTIRLENIPSQSWVYLDGKPVEAKIASGSVEIALPAGNYGLQVENLRANSVMVARRRITVAESERIAITLYWWPVYIANLANHAGVSGPPGVRALRGEEGRPASMSPPLDSESIENLLRESIQILLADTGNVLTNVDNRIYHPHLGNYWYYPQIAEPVFGVRIGPGGAAGPPGPPGLPGDALAIADYDGVPLVQRLSEQLGINLIADSSAKLDARARNIAIAGTQPEVLKRNPEQEPVDISYSKAIPVFTPDLKLHLDRAYKIQDTWLKSRNYILVHDAWGPTGILGAPGPRGKDGFVTHEQIASIRLPEERVQAILDHFISDEQLQQRVNLMRMKLMEVEHRVYVREQQSAQDY